MLVRVAAVQLNSTADHAANLAVADRLTRAAAADGAKLIVLPEKWTAMGADERAARRRRAARRPGDPLGARRSRASSASISSPARSSSASPGGRSSPTPPCTSTPAASSRAVYRKMHMFDVEVGGRVYRESELEQPGEEIVLSRDRRRASSWACRSATTCASPSSTGSSPCAARAIITVPGRVHAGDDARPLGDAAARARDREPGVRDRRQPDRRAPAAGQHSGGRSMIVDPWGVVLAQAADGEGHIVADLDLERQRGDPRQPARRSPTAAPRPTAGRRRCAA